MYIFFNNNGNEFLRYFDDKMPEELKENKYIEIDEKDIPRTKKEVKKLLKMEDNNNI